MKSAVKKALLTKKSVQAYNQDIQNYKRQRKGTLSGYLPSITLTEKAYNSSYSVKSAFGITASQTVIDFSTVNNFKLFSSYVSSAQHSKELHEDVTRLSTETSFLNAYLMQQKFKLIELLYNSSKESFDKAKNQFNLNLTNKTTFLTEKTTYAESLASVNSYKEDLENAEKDLEFYIGTPIKLLKTSNKVIKRKCNSYTKLSWNQQIKIKDKPVTYYYKKALKNRKDLKVKNDSIETEAQSSQYYTKQYLPKVSLSGSLTKYTYRTASSAWSKDIGVSLSWNVFDGLSNYFNKSAADARKLKAILEKGDLSAQIKKEVQTAYTALKKERYNLTAQEISYTQAKSSFDLQKKQYEQGLISKVDYKTAKYSLESNRFIWLSQTATTKLKYQELLYTCGYPTKKIKQ